MVTLLIGKKGTGKTKKLISLANEAVAASTGNVVVIEKGSKLTYDVTDILVDSTFKICPEALAGLETFTKKLQDLAETASTNIVLLISADESEIPESINAVCRKV